jgi:hypothetical protein
MEKACHFNKTFSILAAVFWLSACGASGFLQPSRLLSPCQSEDIKDRLACVPGLTFTEVTVGTPAGYRQFTLQFEQPVDHHNPSGPRFKQKLVLLHRSDTDPMLLQTSGYKIFGVALSKIATQFGMNQLQVEHRFFADSIPATTDRNWSLLNIEQSASDFHRITVALKEIYSGHWVNTGASKGGMTSVYHRRFYPGDLDGTIAYVAPLSFSRADERYIDFVDTVGGTSYAPCRAKLEEVQRALLTKTDEIVAGIEESGTATFDQLGSATIGFEHAVIELPFAYWQYQDPTDTSIGCDAMPTANASTATLVDFLNAVSNPVDSFGDEALTTFMPYFFQAAAQLGAPGAKLGHIADLLEHEETYNLDQYVPSTLPHDYDDAVAMQDVKNWVETSSSKIMFIYGELDPWSAGAFAPKADSDSYLYLQSGGNHGSNIFDLSPTDKAAALATISRWLDKNEEEAISAVPAESGRETLEELELRVQRRHGR